MKPKLKLSLKRNAPTILSVIAAAGTITTAVLAVRATPKAMRMIQDAEWEKGKDNLEETGQLDPLTPMETVKVAWKPYIPAVMMGLGTIVCIFGANGLSRKQQASLISAYTLLDQGYREYQKKAKELLGSEKVAEIHREVAKDHHTDEKPHGKRLLFFDFFSGQYFNASMEELIDAEYQLNKKMATQDYVTIGEWYELLGLENDIFGDALGWSIGAGENFYNYQWLDFEHELATMDDGLECYIVHMLHPPTADFADYC